MNFLPFITLICIFAICFDLFLTGEATKGSKKLDGKPHGIGHSQIKSAHSSQGGAIKKVKPTKRIGNHRDNKHQMKLNNEKPNKQHFASNRKNKAGSVNKHVSEKVIRKGNELLAVKNEKSQLQSLKKDNNKPADSALGKLDKNKKKKHSVVTAKIDNLESQLEFCRTKCCKTADGLLVQKEGQCQNQKQSTVLVRRKRTWINCGACWNNYSDNEWDMCPRCFPNEAKNLLGDVTRERNPAESSDGNTRIYNVPGSTLLLPQGAEPEAESETESENADEEYNQDEGGEYGDDAYYGNEDDDRSEIDGENNGNEGGNGDDDNNEDNNIYVESSTDNEDNTDDENNTDSDDSD